MEWTSGVETWIRRAIALALSSHVAGSLLIGPAGFLDWLSVCVLVFAVHRLTRARPRPFDAMLPVLALAATLAGLDTQTPWVGPGMAFLLLVAAVVSSAALSAPRTAAVLICASCLAYGWRVGGGARDPLSTALDVIGVLAAGAGAAGICLAFRRAARRADDAQAASVAVERRRRQAEAKAVASFDARRLVHDHLVATLSVVANAPDGDLSRRAAREALSALRSFHQVTRESSDTFHLPPTAPDAVVRDRRLPGQHVPAEVWDAATDAAREALRNAARHAPGARVTVDLHGDREHLTIVVADDGQGFTPDHQPGFGMTSSIAARMTEIGGSSSVRSAPGSGTTVTLTWRADSTPTSNAGRWALLRDTVGSLRPLLAFPLWHLGAQALMAVTHGTTRTPLSAATAVVSVILLCLLVHAAARRPLGPALTWTAATVPAAFVAWGLWLAGPGALNGYGSWIVGMADVSVIVLALLVSARSAAVGSLLITSAVLVTAVADPHLSPADVPIPLTQAATHALFFGVIARGVRRIGEGAHAAYERELQSLLLQDRARERSARLSATLDDVEGRVRTLLSSVVDRTASDAEAVGLEARILAQALRDELIVPGLLNTSARAGVEAMRRRGGAVLFRPPIPAEFADSVTELVASLAAEPVRRDCTITTNLEGPATVVASCRPAAPAVRPASWTADHDSDGSLFACRQSR